VSAEHVHPEEEYYLLASASAQRRPQFLLNHAESFAIFDLGGDIPLARREAYGLFHCGTRFLSRYELRLNGQLPLLLSTMTTHEGSGVVTYLSNADEVQQGEVILLRDSVAVRRDKTLLAGTLYERIHLHNFTQEPLSLELRFLCGADFAGSVLKQLPGLNTPCCKFHGAGVAVVAVQCPECESQEVVRYGRQANGEQRYRCNNVGCGRRIFLGRYHHSGRLPEVKRQIVDMALNGSGIRDTARVLGVSPMTVMSTLKKKRRRSTR